MLRLINNRARQIILMRFIPLSVWGGVAKTNKDFMWKGASELSMRVNQRSFFVLLTFEEIFYASQTMPAEPRTQPLEFFPPHNKCENAQKALLLPVCARSRVWVLVPVSVCVMELCRHRKPQKPVISRVKAGLKANMKINWGTYNNTWKNGAKSPLTVLPNKARLFITLGRCMLPRFACLLWALKLI